MIYNNFSIIDVLLEKQLLSKDQFHICQLEAKSKNINILQASLDLAFITPEIIQEIENQRFNTQKIDLNHCIIDKQLLNMIPKSIAIKYKFFPISIDFKTKKLIIATHDIHNLPLFDQLRIEIYQFLNFYPNIDILRTNEHDLINTINNHYQEYLNIDKHFDTTQKNDDFAENFINMILLDAVAKSATDIHIQPEENFIRIRYRLDGVLHQQKSIHKEFMSSLINRLKIIAKADIAENRTAQDGHFDIQVGTHSIDVRISFLPTIHGENVVLRLLNKHKNLLDLNHICVFDWQKELIEKIIKRPEGLILITGPTGSGKTTTLYSILNQLNSPDLHIVTLEDPVEYIMPMINQVSLNESVKLNFADGIRAILRQDPDIILIGEIRDAETAQMALRASMTGHQVYSTLHTNSAIGTFGRLLDMGISSTILSDKNINGIIGQRLVRKLCKKCNIISDNNAYQANTNGCEDCHFTGYHGQFALMEILPMTNELEYLIENKASRKEIMNYLEHQDISNFKSLKEVGELAVKQGITSSEEIKKCIG